MSTNKLRRTALTLVAVLTVVFGFTANTAAAAPASHSASAAPAALVTDGTTMTVWYCNTNVVAGRINLSLSSSSTRYFSVYVTNADGNSRVMAFSSHVIAPYATYRNLTSSEVSTLNSAHHAYPDLFRTMFRVGGSDLRFAILEKGC